MHGLMGARLRRWLQGRGRHLEGGGPKKAASSASDPANEHNSRQPLVAPKPEELLTRDGNHEGRAAREAAPGEGKPPDTPGQAGES
jgi:hypothetical protein